MAGEEEEFFDVPTYTTTMFGSTLAVMGVTPDVQPELESVRTYSFEERFFRKLFFKDDRLVGAIMIGPPKGRKKLIEIMRSRQKIERPKQELLDPTNLASIPGKLPWTNLMRRCSARPNVLSFCAKQMAFAHSETPEHVRATLGAVLRRRREASEWSLADIARPAGISTAYL